MGKAGVAVGIDIRKAAVDLAHSNIKQLRLRSQQFGNQAGRCKIELHNVFMPSSKHRVRCKQAASAKCTCQQPLDLFCKVCQPAETL